MSGTVETYQAALDWLLSFADYERRRPDAYTPQRFSLERPRALLAALGHPEQRYQSIIIAGTKGKGSTAAMLAQILRAAGLRVGLYTQPHLVDYRERIRCNGRLISRRAIIAGVQRLRAAAAHLTAAAADLGPPTTYELGTALALDYFARAGVQWAVLEVGLGGRLDAVNAVAEPALSVITSISYDHTELLGDTLDAIAREKAGILRPGRPAVCSAQQPEAQAALDDVARRLGVALLAGGRDFFWETDARAACVWSASGTAWPQPWRYDCLRIALRGAHQIENAATALAALEALRLTAPQALPALQPEDWAGVARTALAAVRWPGRLEVHRVRRPDGRMVTVVLDGAHNVDSAQRLAQALRERVVRHQQVLLVLGTSQDKDLPGIVAALAPVCARAWAVAAASPRARPAQEVAGALHALLPAESAPSVGAGLEAAICAAGPGDIVLVTGSLYVVGEVIAALKARRAG
jgi:dihydrofolate synthase/folylpolyglutamate synthase